MKKGVQMNENVKPIQVKNDNPGKVRKRQRSTIGFPYADYDSSLGIATAIHSMLATANVPQNSLPHGQTKVLKVALSVSS